MMSAVEDEAAGPHVVVVDDDELVRELVAEVLGSAGYRVTATADATAALEVLAADLPSLVLSDVNMPGLDGFQMLERLRAMPGADSVPFVFLTTRAGSDDLVRGLRLGADDYLVKPFAVPELLARVAAKINRPSVSAAVLGEMAARAGTEQRMVQELRRAAAVQRGLLPRHPPTVPGYDIAGACVPSQSVAGDFYDWYEQAGSLTLTVADVMGKGIGGAILMATVRAVLRGTSGQGDLPDGVVQAASILSDDLDQTTSFVTLFHGCVDLPSGWLSYVDAGHGLACVARAAGPVERLDRRGLPLGLFDDATWEEGRIHIGGGDALVVFSDGLLEAIGDPASDEDVMRVLHHVGAVARDAPSAALAVSSLTAMVERHADDVTVVVLRRAA